ncbi:MAG TPA: hypothetical protein VEH04_16445 [Verrucomicrobiae bacterium]|nr:hypothetical protein [Verrucomicrobiae bacterium]
MDILERKQWAGIAVCLSLIVPAAMVGSEVEVAREPRGPYTAYATRTLEDLPELAALPADANLSQYGGWKGRQVQATGFFYATNIAGRWWLADPEGFLFLHKGIAAVSQLNTPGARAAHGKIFGNEKQWAQHTAQLMRSNGFNGLGAWSDTERLRQASPPLVYTRIWNFMSGYGTKRGGIYQKSGHMGYPNDCIFVFDPGFEAFCDEHAKRLSAQKDDPWLLGHFSDNELPLWRTSLKGFLKFPENDPGHQAALKWLRERHGQDATVADIAEQDERDFLGFVADRYFRIVSRAIKKYDPNHLFLGSRINGRATTYPEIFRAAAPYLDVIAVNYYWAWTPDANLMGMWNRESGRPVMITEWYAKGMDSGLANRSGAGWTVKTQADRGRFYQNFTLSLLESKICVGWDWFKYTDNDPDAVGVDPSNVDSNKGIVSNRYLPYRPLLDAMKQVNDRSYGLVHAMDAVSERK